MNIFTWNVNSINARLENVLNFIKENSPDVLCLQELKCENHKFPQELLDLNYNILINGQKSYNGVAILSKYPIEEIANKIDDNIEDTQARYLEALITGPNNNVVRLINVYCPNGNPINTPKYDYKIEWMGRLNNKISELLKYEEALIICGDWNIIPNDNDCYDPKAWADDALFLPTTRETFHTLLNQGMYDAFKILNNKDHQYTFWDYQQGAWPRNLGIRIDTHILSPIAADCLKSFKIWRDERDRPKASDHVPVSIELGL